MSKTALITGGSSGLGYEMAKNLAAKGYTLILLARDKEKIDRTVSELRSGGFDAAGYQCDVTA